ncbi:MAG: hypothetical protein AAB510_00255 [Patescibacteria group bacterium]
MPKNQIQDMVKVKSIRNIPKRHHTEQKKVSPRPLEVRQHHIRKEEYFEPKKGGNSKYSLWFVSIVPILFFIFAISYLFTRAEVTVEPKTQNLVLSQSLSAIKNSTTEDLGFNLVIISGEEEEKVLGKEEKDVALASKGTVFVYNSFSSAPQKLLIDTRLEGSNGKIYKTASAFTVPGMAKDGTPGKVQVSIYGSEPGPEYDDKPLDFKIFGFKGTPKYEKFYARSEGNITGGFIGKSPVISDDDKIASINTLKDKLGAKLLQKAGDQIPSGFILFKNAFYLNIDEEKFDVDSNNEPVLKVKGTLYGILFNEQDLTKKIAESNIKKYDGSEIYIPGIRDLTFNPGNGGILTSNIALTERLDFNLTGNTKLVWKVDQAKLTKDLAGKSKKSFGQTLGEYPNIESANLSISPFWSRSIPSKTKYIKVVIDDTK